MAKMKCQHYLESKGENYLDKQFGINKGHLDRRILRNFDESLLESGTGYAGSPGEANYVVISDGSLETVVTDGSGNVTRVKIDTVDVEEFLDYLLDQGRITVEQRDEYGRTNSLKLTLRDVEDAAGFFDWVSSTDEGLYVGIDRDDVNYIRDELLPLFSFRD